MFFTELKDWLWNILIWLDQGINVVFRPLLNGIFNPNTKYRFGHADETLSSVFGKNKEVNPVIDAGRRFINGLFFWQDDHCESSIEWDEGVTKRRQQ